MSTKMRAAPRAAPDDTKSQIKAAAQLLFARHGVDAVTVQQIVDGGRPAQQRRAALSFRIEGRTDPPARGRWRGGARRAAPGHVARTRGPRRAGDASARCMLVLVMPVIELGEDERWRGYIRFTSSLQASDRKTLRAALNNRWNAGYVACFAHLKRMLPLPAAADRAAAVDVLDLRQRHPVGARGRAGNAADPEQPAVGPALHHRKHSRHAGGDDHLPAVAGTVAVLQADGTR